MYHYFPTKLDLGYAVVDEILGGSYHSNGCNHYCKLMIQLLHLIQYHYAAGHEITEEDIQCGCPLNNLAQEMAPVDEGFRLACEAVYRSWRKGIEQCAFERSRKRFCK